MKTLLINKTWRKKKKLKKSAVHWARELRGRRVALGSAGVSTQGKQSPAVAVSVRACGVSGEDGQDLQGGSVFQQWGLGWERNVVITILYVEANGEKEMRPSRDNVYKEEKRIMHRKKEL